MGIKKLTERQFNLYKQEHGDGKWYMPMKYGLNLVTIRRIKKSRTYADYIGRNGKHGIADPQ
ncbi:MAG: hypothetical protein WA087_03720 [Candidatus Saccharimonadales bacterium]